MIEGFGALFNHCLWNKTTGFEKREKRQQYEIGLDWEIIEIINRLSKDLFVLCVLFKICNCGDYSGLQLMQK